MRNLVFTTAIGLLWTGAACAADACAPPARCDQAPACCPDPGCCPRCGAKLVCQVVCEQKEIKKTVWVVKCEPFCPPLPNFRGDCVCGNPDCSGCTPPGRDPCAAEKAKSYVPPKCAPVRIRKTLEKKEVTCKVPAFRCVPFCPQCAGCDPGCGR